MAGMQALIVVDVQNDFLPGGALGIAEGDRIVPAINEYVRRFHAAGLPIIASRDWHPVKTKHFNTEGGPWPPHCVQSTPGAAFAPALRLPEGVAVVSKGMDPNDDSYSAFDARDSKGNQLETLLRSHVVSHLYICGLATDYCVRYTRDDAVRKGFGITVLVDAVRGVDDEESRKVIMETQRQGGELATLGSLSLAGEGKRST